MLVDQEASRERDADVVGPTDGEPRSEHNQGYKRQAIHDARPPERANDTEAAGNGVQPCLLLEVIVLSVVKDVEAACPEGDSKRKQDRLPRKAAGYAYPCGRKALLRAPSLAAGSMPM